MHDDHDRESKRNRNLDGDGERKLNELSNQIREPLNLKLVSAAMVPLARFQTFSYAVLCMVWHGGMCLSGLMELQTTPAVRIVM
jgi:hypothetical protein